MQPCRVAQLPDPKERLFDVCLLTIKMPRKHWQRDFPEDHERSMERRARESSYWIHRHHHPQPLR